MTGSMNEAYGNAVILSEMPLHWVAFLFAQPYVSTFFPSPTRKHVPSPSDATFFLCKPSLVEQCVARPSSRQSSHFQRNPQNLLMLQPSNSPHFLLQSAPYAALDNIGFLHSKMFTAKLFSWIDKNELLESVSIDPYASLEGIRRGCVVPLSLVCTLDLQHFCRYSTLREECWAR